MSTEVFPEPQKSDDLLRITTPYDQYWHKRAEVIQTLFAKDRYSIDAIALAVICLSSLATYRYADTKVSRAPDQSRFRLLLLEHGGFIENRISIPELIRFARKNKRFTNCIVPIINRFPVLGNSQVRQISDDPTLDEFNAWAEEQQPVSPELLSYDYAGCIFRIYRNAVVHGLQVGNGREAFGYFIGESEDKRTVFYDYRSNSHNDAVEACRFGIYPLYLLKLLKCSIQSLRQWSIINRRDLFSG